MNGPVNRTIAVLLAGGLARRMGGGDKCMVELAGQTLLTHVIARMIPQVQKLVINANGDPSRFGEYGLPVIADTVDGFAGPLAGVLAGLEWIAIHAPDTTHMISVPTDTPFLPTDLATRLADAARSANTPLAVAASAGRTHPVVGLWSVALLDDLRAAVVDEGIRKVDVWTSRHGIAEAEFACVPHDPFFNLNTPQDIVEAEARLESLIS